MKNPNQDGKDKENELRAKIEVAAKSETRASPSNPEEEESEGMKELATTEEEGKPKVTRIPSEQDEEKSKELKKAAGQQEKELESKIIQKQNLCLQIQMRMIQRK